MGTRGSGTYKDDGHRPAGIAFEAGRFVHGILRPRRVVEVSGRACMRTLSASDHGAQQHHTHRVAQVLDRCGRERDRCQGFCVPTYPAHGPGPCPREYQDPSRRVSLVAQCVSSGRVCAQQKSLARRPTTFPDSARWRLRLEEIGKFPWRGSRWVGAFPKVAASAAHRPPTIPCIISEPNTYIYLPYLTYLP